MISAGVETQGRSLIRRADVNGDGADIQTFAECVLSSADRQVGAAAVRVSLVLASVTAITARWRAQKKMGMRMRQEPVTTCGHCIKVEASWNLLVWVEQQLTAGLCQWRRARGRRRCDEHR